ncbi:isopentenyl diphosphate isomerase/L-lactate dehydrogenase-like FMN-dependent dehydrogenase [Rhodococcus sp. 27YEA15]
MTRVRAHTGTTSSELELGYRHQFDTFADVERLARRTLPNAMFERLNSGVGDGATFRANRQAYQEVEFRPRGASVSPDRSTVATVLGEEISAPVILAPVGALRLQHPAGAVAAIEAAGRFGTVCAVSPATGHPLTELTPSNDSPLWAQVTTAMAGRDAAEQSIDTIKSLGYKAIVVTVDSALRPKTPPIRLNARTIASFAPDLVRHPRWTVGFLRDGMRLSVANSAVGASASTAARPLAWNDLTWMGDQWGGPIVVKGVVTAEDARRAVDLGASAIVVSNHGGLTVDSAPATLRVLPEVLEAVGDRVEVLVDGGIRTGNDVVKALALGAKSVLVGRAYVMALAVGGAAGVLHMLELLQDDIQRALAFLGCSSIQELGPEHVRVPGDWARV